MSDEPTTDRGRPRRGLGRGLDALLPAAELPAPGMRVVAVERIEPNPQQPRRRFDADKQAELAASIKEHGLVQPLVVSEPTAGKYRLIVGERRWQAARIAGLAQIPVIVKEASDRETLELALIENVQRADLDPLEEAAAYQRLMQDFGLTQAQVATQVGKSRVAIANTVRLLALPETLKRALVTGQITEGHGRALLGLPNTAEQLAALERVEREGLNVRQTEALVRRLLEAGGTNPNRPQPHPDVEALEDELRRAIGSKVQVKQGRRGGRIVIEYGSDEEFQGIYRRLIGTTERDFE